tara:strand:- start:437 stop:709 length:273 start_codon:yes stop_codon:yes gene_type:complete
MQHADQLLIYQFQHKVIQLLLVVAGLEALAQEMELWELIQYFHQLHLLVEDLEILEVQPPLQEMVVRVVVDQVTHQIQLVQLQEQETHLQ